MTGPPATFYPYYTSGNALGGCAWTVGQNVPGFSTNDYGKLAQYGSLLKVTYPDPGRYHHQQRSTISRRSCRTTPARRRSAVAPCRRLPTGGRRTRTSMVGRTLD